MGKRKKNEDADGKGSIPQAIVFGLIGMTLLFFGSWVMPPLACLVGLGFIPGWIILSFIIYHMDKK